MSGAYIYPLTSGELEPSGFTIDAWVNRPLTGVPDGSVMRFKGAYQEYVFVAAIGDWVPTILQDLTFTERGRIRGDEADEATLRSAGNVEIARESGGASITFNDSGRVHLYAETAGGVEGDAALKFDNLSWSGPGLQLYFRGVQEAGFSEPDTGGQTLSHLLWRPGGGGVFCLSTTPEQVSDATPYPASTIETNRAIISHRANKVSLVGQERLVEMILLNDIVYMFVDGQLISVRDRTVFDTSGSTSILIQALCRNLVNGQSCELYLRDHQFWELT